MKRQCVLAGFREQGDADFFANLRARLGAEGELPTGIAGDVQLRKLFDQVKPYAQAMAMLSVDPRVAATTETFSLELGRYRLHGALHQRYQQGFARCRIGALAGRHHVRHGLDALVLAALQQPLPLLEFGRSTWRSASGAQRQRYL